MRTKKYRWQPNSRYRFHPFIWFTQVFRTFSINILGKSCHCL